MTKRKGVEEMKKVYISILSIVVMSCLISCGTNQTEVSSGMSEINEAESSSVKSSASLISDEELINRVLYLLEPFTHPVTWYTAAGDTELAVWEAEYVDPLEDTPEGTKFYPVTRFDSIAEMKRATEQVMTKEFAEKNLYPLLDKYNQFLERDNMLYRNTLIGRGAWPFKADSATVVSKSEDTAVLSVTFIDFRKKEEVRNVEMKFENQTWKLNSSPYI